MEEKELEQLIQKETKELSEKQFLNGVLVGWNTCLFSIKKEISGMTSSRKIKKFIDKKIEESQKRVNKEIENIKNESEEKVNSD